MGLPPFLKSWKNREVKYVIYSPPYSDRWGGVMALFGLADALNKIGAGALIWPSDVSPGRRDLLNEKIVRARGSARRLVRRALRPLRAGGGTASADRDEGRTTNGVTVGRTSGSLYEPAHTMRRATYFELKTAVVVYPEITEGNPLGADRVVRWFLNRPGRLTGTIDYGPGELYFYQQAIFNDPSLGPVGGELVIVNVMDDIYKQVNFGRRSGSCYILRKGKARAPKPSELDGPVIDDLTHREIAKLFNECEYCISYDLHTFFSYYAALCGCKSVVVPEPGLDRNEWQPREEFTYGIAYGFSDIDRAETTKPRVNALLKQIQDNNLASAASFHRRCAGFFFP